MNTMYRASLGIVLALAIAPAHAVSVASQFFGGQLNQLSDNDAESQNVDTNNDGFLWVGDTLRATGEIETIEDLTGGGGTNVLGSAGVNEFSFISEIEVTAATVLLDGDGSCGVDPTCGGGANLTGDEVANFTFGPNAAFIAEFGLAAGTMIAMYDDATPDYDRTGSIANAETTATDGTRIFDLGFGGDLDETWQAFAAPTDPTVATTVPAGTPVGEFFVQISFLANNSGVSFEQVAAGCNSFLIPTFPCGGDGQIDINGQGGLLGTQGATTGYDLFSNVDFTVRVVSEPSVIALLGMGMIGVGAMRRRRRQVKV